MRSEDQRRTELLDRPQSSRLAGVLDAEAQAGGAGRAAETEIYVDRGS